METPGRSASIGAETWAVASRKITTITTFETIKAMTKDAHLLSQPRVWSKLELASAMGAKTIAISSRALRTSKLIQTRIAAPMASPAMKIVTIAPAPGCGDVEAGQPSGKQRDPVAHLLGVGPGRMHDPDAQLISNLESRSQQCESDE